MPRVAISLLGIISSSRLLKDDVMVASRDHRRQRSGIPFGRSTIEPASNDLLAVGPKMGP